jgi:hypothetical protein
LYGTSLFNLHSCILCISFFIILNNVETFLTQYLYFCRWNLKKRKTIEEINKSLFQITQVMEVARALKKVPAKNDDQYIWISMQVVVFFEIIVCESQTFFFNVMKIVSRLKENGLPISVPFCMKKTLLFIYTKIRFILFYCIVQCCCEMLHH